MAFSALCSTFAGSASNCSNYRLFRKSWHPGCFNLTVIYVASASSFISETMKTNVYIIIFSFQKNVSFKGGGNVLAGLGFFFLGIHYMKEGFDVFIIRGFEPEVPSVANWLGIDGFLLDKISEAFVEGCSAFKILWGSLCPCQRRNDNE